MREETGGTGGETELRHHLPTLPLPNQSPKQIRGSVSREELRALVESVWVGVPPWRDAGRGESTRKDSGFFGFGPR